jgi:hypothetical protein
MTIAEYGVTLVDELYDLGQNTAGHSEYVNDKCEDFLWAIS